VGVGVGVFGVAPTPPNPQSPIPNPQSPKKYFFKKYSKKLKI